MTPEFLTVMMFVGVTVGIFAGFPVAFALTGMGLIFGMIGWGPMAAFNMMGARAYSTMTNYMFVAIPLFVFMGSMLQSSGVAESAFGVLRQWLQNIKGGLGIATVILCVIFGSCVGVVGASVTTMAMLTLPPMINNGYKNSLATGIVAAGGTLGILLPPSIMMIVLGPVASVSVIKLFAGTIPPGLLLGFCYGLYVFIFVRVKKDAIVPVVQTGEIKRYTIIQGLGAFLPLIMLIFTVLGAIFFGFAAPTEAAGVGALGAILIAAGYRQLNRKTIHEAAMVTVRASTMVMFVIMGASIFTSTFFGIGGTKVLAAALQDVGLEAFGTLILVMVVVFVIGIFIDWVGVILIVVPVFLPILIAYGYDPLYVCLLVCVMLQTSFVTPPFAYTIFYIMGVAPKGVQLIDVYKGVVPFICIQVLVVGFCVAFPGFLGWLPAIMVPGM